MKAKKATRIKELASKTDAEKVQLMSIRERLENKLETDEIDVLFKDNLGEFKVKFAKLSPKEHDELQRIEHDMKVAGSEVEQTKETKEKV